PPDPVVQSEWDCAYVEQHSFPVNGRSIALRIHRPAHRQGQTCTSEWPATDSFPLLVFGRGNGYTYLQYDYLAEHLAQNGFVVAIPANSGAEIYAEALKWI